MENLNRIEQLEKQLQDLMRRQQAQQQEFLQLQDELMRIIAESVPPTSLIPEEEPATKPTPAPEIPYAASGQIRRPQPSGEGVEKLFGKNIMGVIASLLIFVALISFAVLIYDKIPELLKALGMFLLSGGIGIIGYLIGRRSRSSFSVSLLSCGVGGIYISIIAMNLVFHYISGIMVYLCLFGWIIGLTYLSEKLQYQKLFRLICQIGVMCSLFMGIFGDPSLTEYFMISLYTFASLGVIAIRDKDSGSLSLIGNGIDGITFCTLITMGTVNLSFSQWQSKAVMAVNLTVFLCFFLLIQSKHYRHIRGSKGIAVLTAISQTGCYSIGVLVALVSIFDFSSAWYYITAIILLAAVLVPGWMGKIETGVELGIFISILCVMPPLLQILFWGVYDVAFTGLSILYIPLLCQGFRQRKRLYEITGHIMLLLDLCITGSMEISFYFTAADRVQHWMLRLDMVIILLTILAMTGYLVKRREVKYSVGYKLYFHIGLHIVLTQIFGSFYGEYQAYWSLSMNALLFALVVLSGYYHTWNQDFKFFFPDQEGIRKMQMANALLSIGAGVFFLAIIDCIWRERTPALLRLVFIALGALFTLLNNRSFYKVYRNSRWLGWYIGSRLTIYFLAVICSVFDFGDYPYLLSILLVLISCACIYVGFIKDFTSFRIYGLVLTMGAVLKLVTYDIIELNSMIRVAAFIIGGVLCFAISRLYNNASRKKWK